MNKLKDNSIHHKALDADTTSASQNTISDTASASQSTASNTASALQNTAPIYDFIKMYAEKNSIRLHMPGHKGLKINSDAFSDSFRYDITEISGADSLYEASGIIRQSERYAAKLFGSCDTVYSAGGSTLCIQAMLYLMKMEHRTVIAVRNVHRAFVNASVMLGLDVIWIHPKFRNGIALMDSIYQEIEIALENLNEPACVYITSPDYLGQTADIDIISRMCQKHAALLIVDNAHGAHLAFFDENQHPLAHGADLCCDSAHKMLPALTGAAYLHSANGEYTAEKLKYAMSLFGSTSPSYLILASLDLCNQYLESNIKYDISIKIPAIKSIRQKYAHKYNFYNGEPFHLTITGIDGLDFLYQLEKMNLQAEYADKSMVIMLISPSMPKEYLIKLDNALDKLQPHYTDIQIELPHLECAMSMRDAVLAQSVVMPIEHSCNLVSAQVVAPCPPAIPIIVPGEVISYEAIRILKDLGISHIKTVSKDS